METLKSQDFLSGLLFTGIGLFGLYLTSEHDMGTAARMGPGYFPALVTGGLTLLGIATMARACADISPGFGIFAWRPFIFMIGGTLFFAYAIDRIGMLLTVGILAVLCRLAEQPFRPREVAVLGVVMVVLSLSIFHYGLGLPFRILP